MRKIQSTVKSVFEAVMLAKLLWSSFDNNAGRTKRNAEHSLKTNSHLKIVS